MPRINACFVITISPFDFYGQSKITTNNQRQAKKKKKVHAEAKPSKQVPNKSIIIILFIYFFQFSFLYNVVNLYSTILLEMVHSFVEKHPSARENSYLKVIANS